MYWVPEPITRKRYFAYSWKHMHETYRQVLITRAFVKCEWIPLASRADTNMLEKHSLRIDQDDDLRAQPHNGDNIIRFANAKDGPNTLPRREGFQQSSGSGQTTPVDTTVPRPAKSCGKYQHESYDKPKSKHKRVRVCLVRACVHVHACVRACVNVCV
jgi:hypothetical protein